MGQEVSRSSSIFSKSELRDSRSPSSHSLHSSKSLSSPMCSMTKTETSSNLKDDKKQIENGVIGEYLSFTVAKTAYVFWKRNIDCLSREEQLEIGCSIYFGMMTSGEDMKDILWNSAKVPSGSTRVKRLGLQFVHMMGWLSRQLLANDINLKATLAQLGAAHKALGINASHFIAMLSFVHETFAYYFEHKYSIKERYAIDKVFRVGATLMMNENIDSWQMTDGFVNLDFLHSLAICLKTDVGKTYLYRYFQQTFCDELVIYLQSIHRFKAATSDKERFIIARDICKASIKSTAPFAINISYEARGTTLNIMKKLEVQFFDPCNDKEFKVPTELFDECDREIMNLIKQNHWSKFKTKIRMLRSI